MDAYLLFPRALAQRTEPFQESVIREMTRLGDEAGAVNLSQGLPDFDPPPEVLRAAARHPSGDNQYTFPSVRPNFARRLRPSQPPTTISRRTRRPTSP